MSARDELIALNLARVIFDRRDDEHEEFYTVRGRTNEDAADVLLGSKWLRVHDAETLLEAADEYPGSSTHPSVVWLLARAAEYRKETR